MVDNLSFSAKGDFLKEILEKYSESESKAPDLIQFGRLTLTSIKDRKTFKVKSYQCEIKNLLFTLNHFGLKVSNSLHKFSDAEGLNYSDFTFSQLITVISEIEELTGISTENFLITNAEFALNISVENPPHQYLKYFQDYRFKDFDKMRAGGFWYGIKYNLSQYQIKIYDKTKHLKNTSNFTIPDNVLRFEIKYTKSQRIPEIRLLSDLLERDKIKKVFDDFFKIFSAIPCQLEDVGDLSNRQRELFFAGKSADFWQSEKSINTNTYKGKRSQYKKLQEVAKSVDFRGYFIDEMKQKFNFLLSN